MYQRFVCFKFKEGTPDGAIQKHLAMFAGLKESIPQIVSYAGGEVVKGGEGGDKYDSAHYVTYATKEDIDVYFHHETHQAFIEANEEHWENVLVVDSELV